MQVWDLSILFVVVEITDGDGQLLSSLNIFVYLRVDNSISNLSVMAIVYIVKC